MKQRGCPLLGANKYTHMYIKYIYICIYIIYLFIYRYIFDIYVYIYLHQAEDNHFVSICDLKLIEAALVNQWTRERNQILEGITNIN